MGILRDGTNALLAGSLVETPVVSLLIWAKFVLYRTRARALARTRRGTGEWDHNAGKVMMAISLERVVHGAGSFAARGQMVWRVLGSFSRSYRTDTAAGGVSGEKHRGHAGNTPGSMAGLA